MLRAGATWATVHCEKQASSKAASAQSTPEFVRSMGPLDRRIVDGKGIDATRLETRSRARARRLVTAFAC
jgi:hypothetical protein